MEQRFNILFNLISNSLFGCERMEFPDASFEEVFREADAHSVLPICFEALSDEERSKTEPEILEKYQNKIIGYAGMRELLLFEQAEVLKLLAENNVSVLILKGSSAAANYPNPQLRVMGDIDILVEPQNQRRTVELLQKRGYGKILQENHTRHFNIKKGKIAVEVHKEIGGISLIQNPKTASEMRELLSDVLKNPTYTNGIPQLENKYLCIVLLLHKLQHFIHGELGLRQLCDWAVFVGNAVDDAFWQEEVPLLKSFGLYKFACVMTKLCHDYFKLPADRIKWCRPEDDRLCSEIMKLILENGNFGKKNRYYGKQMFVDIKYGNRFSVFYHRALAFARRNNPVLQSHPILLPFFPIFCLKAYKALEKKGERPKLELISIYKKSAHRQGIVKQLKPFEKEITDEY